MNYLVETAFVFILFQSLAFKAHSQDTIQTHKIVYVISPEKLNTLLTTIEENIARPGVKIEGKKPDPAASIQSCEVDPKTNQVIVTKKQENGIITKEIFEQKQAH